jgi:hypothetical protein
MGRWMKLIKNYDCIIDYHSRKANVVVDALSLKNKTVIGELIMRDKKELLELARLEA